MLDVSSIKCNYGNKTVVDDISFTANNGEKVCIIGPNGSGKSTLLKSIVSILDHEGDVFIDNINLKTLKKKDLANKISYMSQISSVYFSYTVFETVLLGRYAKTTSILKSYTKADKDEVIKALEKVSLLHLKDRLITTLSGGELQRVFLAKVFAQDPDIILLDEPTNHLDFTHQIELIDYLDKWVKENNKIVIAVLHDINLALSFADNILLISDGKMVSFGNKDTILKTDDINRIYGIDVRKYMCSTLEKWKNT